MNEYKKRARDLLGLNEVKINPAHKKEIQAWVKEMTPKIRIEFPAATGKQIENTMYSIIDYMGYPTSNPNFKTWSWAFPHRYDKKLISNGDGNTYDSVWNTMTDSQKQTIVKKGMSQAK